MLEARRADRNSGRVMSVARSGLIRMVNQIQGQVRREAKHVPLANFSAPPALLG